MRSRVLTTAATCLAFVAFAIHSGWTTPDAAAQEAGAAAAQEAKRPRRPDVPFVPTPQEVVEKMLELAQLQEGDVLYDLGCGDGRIVVTAAKDYGVRAVGIDIDPERVAESRENVEEAGVGDLVTIKQADIFQEDLSEADVVTMYLLPDVNNRLKPQLSKLKEGSRIVSHSFDLDGVKPAQVVRLETDGGVRTLYLWTVPWEEEG
jgi:precorrin-6B methylase 2